MTWLADSCHQGGAGHLRRDVFLHEYDHWWIIEDVREGVLGIALFPPYEVNAEDSRRVSSRTMCWQIVLQSAGQEFDEKWTFEWFPMSHFTNRVCNNSFYSYVYKNSSGISGFLR